MTTMRTLRILSSTLVIIGALLSPFSTTRAADTPKPNFVVILIDDMGYGDVGPFGSKAEPHAEPGPHGQPRG